MPAARHRTGARRLNKHGETWDETVHRVHAQFPSTTEGRDWWYERLGSDKLLGGFLHDVLNLAVQEGTPVRRGSRPPLEYAAGMAALRQLRGDDFTHLSFPEAFTVLAHGRSCRHVANRCTMSKSQVQRLLTGEIAPTGEDMERIAAAFGKRGSFFREYRVAIICALTARLLDDDPERTVTIVRSLTAIAPPP